VTYHGRVKKPIAKDAVRVDERNSVLDAVAGLVDAQEWTMS